MGVELTTRTPDEFAAAQLSALPGGILSDPFTRQVLSDFYLVLGDLQVEVLDPITVVLDSLLSPERCPVEALDGLLSLAGLSRDLPWLSGLNETTKRKLASVAPAIWRTKGTPDCARNLYRMLAGGLDVVAWDHPFWRYEVGVDSPMLCWPDSPDGAWLQDLHLADPRGDVDRALVAQALGSIRPGSDTWTALWCLVAEPFLQGLSRWTITGSPTWTPGEVTLPAGAALTTPESEMQIARVLTLVEIASGAAVEIRIGDPAGVEYVVALTNGGCAIEAVVAGTPTLLASESPVMAPGVEYVVDVRVWTTVAGTEIEVCLDGDRVAFGSM